MTNEVEEDPRETYKTKMTSEMSREEMDAFRKDWISDWALQLQENCGTSKEDAEFGAPLDWERYCEQEGWTGRDLDIAEGRLG